MPRKKPTATKICRKNITPTAMQEMRAMGYLVARVEHWNPFAKPFGKRVDLFGCIDLLGINSNTGVTLGVQVTSRSAVSARLRKIEALPNALEWLRMGHGLEVWGIDKFNNRKRILVVVAGIVGGNRIEPIDRYELV
jgi:hypothetical protein